jgi:hypothetical protein
MTLHWRRKKLHSSNGKQCISSSILVVTRSFSLNQEYIYNMIQTIKQAHQFLVEKNMNASWIWNLIEIINRVAGRKQIAHKKLIESVTCNVSPHNLLWKKSCPGWATAFKLLKYRMATLQSGLPFLITWRWYCFILPSVILSYPTQFLKLDAKVTRRFPFLFNIYNWEQA